MSTTTKRKWDDAGQEEEALAAKASKTDDSKSASEAAAAAAAIAAKIAAQFAGSPGAGMFGSKDPHDGAYTKDIDINDIRNRYLLTRSTTQEQIQQETGASVTSKGIWVPDRSKATEKDPPLYIHVSANSQETLDKAVAKVHEFINMDLGSLVEDKKDMRRERRKWPEEKLDVGLETLRNFNVRAKVVGPQGLFVKYIQQETQTRVQIKGQGSGFIDNETGRESDEPMHIHITGPDETMVARAKVLTEDLLEVVHIEHGKAKNMMQQQQMELHQAQAAYAAYANSYSAYAQQPAAPGEQPPPPPGAPPPAPGGAQQSPGGPTEGSPPTFQVFCSYYAAYGYDVASQEFKDWAAQQYAQAYGQYPDTSAASQAIGSAASPAPPAPNGAAPPPPPSNDPAPPPPPT